MARRPPGSVFKRCGCRRGRAGLRLGTSCPRLAEDDHGSWFFSLELPRHVGGTRRRIRRGGYASRDEAERALRRLQVTGGRVLTVADWLEIWLATRTRVRDKTLRGYTAHVRLHLAPHLGQVLLGELDTGHLDRAFTALLRQDGVTVATAHRVLATLRSALNTAAREKLIPDNPTRYLQLPPARRPHAVVWTPRRVKEWKRTGVRPAVAVWTPEQTAQFLDYISGHWLYAAFHLIALRGLHRGEAAGLRWCDIDLDRKVAYISWQIQYTNRTLVLCPLKTAASHRVLALDATTVQSPQRDQVEGGVQPVAADVVQELRGLRRGPYRHCRPYAGALPFLYASRGPHHRVGAPRGRQLQVASRAVADEFLPDGGVQGGPQCRQDAVRGRDGYPVVSQQGGECPVQVADVELGQEHLAQVRD